MRRKTGRDVEQRIDPVRDDGAVGVATKLDPGVTRLHGKRFPETVAFRLPERYVGRVETPPDGDVPAGAVARQLIGIQTG